VGGGGPGVKGGGGGGGDGIGGAMVPVGKGSLYGA